MLMSAKCPEVERPSYVLEGRSTSRSDSNTKKGPLGQKLGVVPCGGECNHLTLMCHLLHLQMFVCVLKFFLCQYVLFLYVVSVVQVQDQVCADLTFSDFNRRALDCYQLTV